MIRPLRQTTDINPFTRYLLDQPELGVLLSAFGAGNQGLAQRRRDLAELILGKTFEETTQAGLVLANWTTVDDDDTPPLTGSTSETMAWLKAFVSRRWDFRVGKERDFIPVNAEMLSAATAEAAYSLARKLGMLTPEPAKGDFDHVIVLGGLLRANFNRPGAAAEMIATGSVTTRSVVGLGALRPMSAEELGLAQAIGCPATNEQEALEFGLARAFGFQHEDFTPTSVANLRQVELENGITVRSAGAPIGPDGRPNTGGAFGWFVDKSELVRPGGSILCVTTPIYWIAGQISLMKRMPAGTTLTTIGIDPTKALPGLGQTFRSQHYLQEIKTAIDVLAG